jgi:hypothetical protein
LSIKFTILGFALARVLFVVQKIVMLVSNPSNERMFNCSVWFELSTWRKFKAISLFEIRAQFHNQRLW